MHERARVRGSLPEVILNKEGVYRGDLVHYFKKLFFEAQNLERPYHNFRHSTHIFWLCYLACVYYGDRLTPLQKRELLIAALFHDWDHPGIAGNDDLNVERSVRGMRKHLDPSDKPIEEKVAQIMRATEYPHKMPSEQLSLCEQIIRDADVSQALDVTWIQHVVFGLAKEANMPPLEMLKMQEPFLKSLRFSTEWAQQYFPQVAIDEKIDEARQLLTILSPKSEAAVAA